MGQNFFGLQTTLTIRKTVTLTTVTTVTTGTTVTVTQVTIVMAQKCLWLKNNSWILAVLPKKQLILHKSMRFSLTTKKVDGYLSIMP